LGGLGKIWGAFAAWPQSRSATGRTMHRITRDGQVTGSNANMSRMVTASHIVQGSRELPQPVATFLFVGRFSSKNTKLGINNSPFWGNLGVKSKF